MAGRTAWLKAACGGLILLGGLSQARGTGEQEERWVRLASPAPEVIGRTRKNFAAAFENFEEGMSKAEVEKALGKPDDVRTLEDPGGFGMGDAVEMWCYGTDRHLGFPTLGCVAFNSAGRAVRSAGTRDTGNISERVGEPRLRHLLRLLDEVCRPNHISSFDFDPRPVMASINGIQPLGKELGIAVMREYLKDALVRFPDRNECLMLVMRGLFEVPAGSGGPSPVLATRSAEEAFRVVRPGFLRPPMTGAWTPEDPRKFPLAPLVMVDGIPFVPMPGGGLGGFPELPSEHLDALEKEGDWRKEPPKPSDDPLGTYAKLLAMFPDDTDERHSAVHHVAALQLLRLVNTVYREAPVAVDTDYGPYNRAPEVLAAALPEVRGMKIHWDAQAECYVRADGKVLAPATKARYARTVLKPHFTDSPGATIVVLVQRVNSKEISINVNANYDRDGAPQVKVRVVATGNTEKPLVDESDNSDGMTVGATGGVETEATYTPELTPGGHLRVELTLAGQKYTSQEVEP